MAHTGGLRSRGVSMIRGVLVIVLLAGCSTPKPAQLGWPPPADVVEAVPLPAAVSPADAPSAVTP